MQSQFICHLSREIACYLKQYSPKVPAGCNKRITEIKITVKIYKIFRTNSIKGAIAGGLVATVSCKNSIAPVVQTRDRAKMTVAVAKKAIAS